MTHEKSQLNTPQVSQNPEPYNKYSYDDVAARIDRVRSAFSERGWRINDGSPMGRLFKHTEKFARDWKTKDRDQIDPLTVVQAGHAHRITAAVLHALDNPAAHQTLHRMHAKPFVLGSVERSTGKDLLWELELYYRLSLQGTTVRLEEPDLIADFEPWPCSIACKKIYSEKNLDRTLAKGASQIAKSGNHGIVALNIEDLVPTEQLRVCRTTGELLEIGRSTAAAFCTRNASKLRKLVDLGKVDGYLVALAVSAQVLESTTGFVTLHWATIWTTQEAPAGTSERLAEVKKSFDALSTPQDVAADA
ncbi:hypothetical protein [Burkholderia stagnalis]|uniref:hypothetical protein n=1 Tax=Burkholderia stagnalis TaxID=1503054 RepID=UPI000A889704|nr:hypothetical protein [Burkholderia stagnalis]